MHKELDQKRTRTPHPTPSPPPPRPLLPMLEEARPAATSHLPCHIGPLLCCVTSATTEPQHVSQMPHPASTHLRYKQEILNPPPPLTHPTLPGTPLPLPDQRPPSLHGQPLKVGSRRAEAPLDVFCPVSFHAAPARTLPADLLVFAPSMTTLLRLEESLWTVMKEQGWLLWSLKLQDQSQTLVTSGIVEQI